MGIRPALAKLPSPATQLFAFLLLSASAALPPSALAQAPPVQVAIFTHIEDNVPAGPLGSPQSIQNYLLYRARLISVGHLFQDSGVPWSLQPDWKLLEAALLYEDSTLTQTTNGKNFLRYLKEDLGAVIDPHSHEGSGYNYTDVAHLLDSLDVGTTTVIGGHIWDPDSPFFQEWDRFRVPVAGEHYPWALWRGDILMGSGTPNHVDDPLVSGVWRPQDRYNYFVHDSTGNIAAVGAYRGEVGDAAELHALYESGVVPAEFMLTSSYPVKPQTILRPDGLAAIEDSVITPMLQMQAEGIAALTDFSSMIRTWQEEFASRGYLYDPENPAGADPDGSAWPPASAGTILDLRCVPNPFASRTVVQYSVAHAGTARLSVFDALGREVAVLADGVTVPGSYFAAWDASRQASGTYFLRLRAGSSRGDGSGRGEGAGRGTGAGRSDATRDGGVAVRGAKLVVLR